MVFHDKSGIDAGVNWRRKIEDAIDTTSLLLVLLTPSYLRSLNCREELDRFLQREQRTGRDDLVIPIYYATIAGTTQDHLARALLERQYVDWRSLRFQPFDSSPVRSAVADLTRAIAAAVARTTDQSSVVSTDLDGDHRAGLVERIVEMELAAPRLVRHFVAMVEEQQGVAEETHAATEEIGKIHARPGSSAGRLIIARRLSSRLAPYADRMEDIAAGVRADLKAIDTGIAAMAEELPTSDEEGVEDAVRAMIEGIRDAKRAGDQTDEAVSSMASAYRSVGSRVSTMRPVLQRLVAAANVVTECSPRFARWIELLDDALDKRMASP